MRLAPVVVFGATGFVGRHLRQLARVRGDREVILISRRPPVVPGDERWLRGDLTDPGSLRAALPRHALLVNLAYDRNADAATNERAGDALADLAEHTAAAGVVHLSTATVVGPTAVPWVTEDTPCRPLPGYQQAKLAIETRVRERFSDRCPVTILRPTAVFGDGGLNLEKLVADLRTRPAPENYLRACLYGARAMNLVPVETVAAAVWFATGRVEAQPSLFIVAADEARENNFRDVEGALREAWGQSRRVLPPLAAPTALLRSLQRAMGKGGGSPYTRFSSERLRAAGFRAPIEFVEALQRFARAVVARGRQ